MPALDRIPKEGPHFSEKRDKIYCLLSGLWLMNPGFRERFGEFMKDGKWAQIREVPSHLGVVVWVMRDILKVLEFSWWLSQARLLGIWSLCQIEVVRLWVLRKGSHQQNTQYRFLFFSPNVYLFFLTSTKNTIAIWGRSQHRSQQMWSWGKAAFWLFALERTHLHSKSCPFYFQGSQLS